MNINHYFLLKCPEHVSEKCSTWIKDNQIEVACNRGLIGAKNWVYYTLFGYTCKQKVIDDIRARMLRSEVSVLGKNTSAFITNILSVSNEMECASACHGTAMELLSDLSRIPSGDRKEILLKDLVENLIARKQMKKAFEVIKQMLGDKRIFFEALVFKCIANGDRSLAFTVIKEMSFECNKNLLTDLFQELGNHDELEIATNILTEVPSKMLTEIAEQFGKNKKFLFALAAFKEMNKRHCKSAFVDKQQMVLDCIKGGERAVALEIIDEIKSITETSQNYLLEQLALAHFEHQEKEPIFAIITKLGECATSLLSDLVTKSLEQGNLHLMADFVKEEQRRGFQCSISDLEKAATRCIQDKQTELALIFIENMAWFKIG